MRTLGLARLILILTPLILEILTLRIFYQNDEECNFQKIRGIVGKYLPDVYDQDDLRLLKKLFANTSKNADLMKINNKEEILGSKEIVELSFNAEHFHKNQVKLNKISELRQLYGEDIQDVFINGVINMVNAVIMLDSIVTKLVEQADGGNQIQR